VLSIDKAVHEALGEGLVRFMPPKRWLPLRRGDRRKVVSMTVPGEPQPRRRSVLTRCDGESSYEIGLKLVAGKRWAPVLHLASDMGAVGLPALQWLLNHVGLRATCSFDLLHRLHNDVLGATTAAGLMLTRLEYLQVAKLRKGPFRPGGANHWAHRLARGWSTPTEQCWGSGVAPDSKVRVAL